MLMLQGELLEWPKEKRKEAEKSNFYVAAIWDVKWWSSGELKLVSIKTFMVHERKSSTRACEVWWNHFVAFSVSRRSEVITTQVRVFLPKDCLSRFVGYSKCIQISEIFSLFIHRKKEIYLVHSHSSGSKSKSFALSNIFIFFSVLSLVMIEHTKLFSFTRRRVSFLHGLSFLISQKFYSRRLLFYHKLIFTENLFNFCCFWTRTSLPFLLISFHFIKKYFQFL